MKEFNSLGELASFLKTRIPEMQKACEVALVVATENIEKQAKHLIGQENVAGAGPFESWQPLSDATLYGFVHPNHGYIPGKLNIGYGGQVSETDPLLRTGTLRDSIESKVIGLEGFVGSDDPTAPEQEFGAPHADYPIPPRSFLGISCVTEIPFTLLTIHTYVTAALSGESYL